MENVVLTIPGRPKAKARPKAQRRGAYVHIYTPTSEAEEEVVALLTPFRGRLVAAEAVSVRFVFYGAHGNSDIDNLMKLYLDALVKADVFGDDRKVEMVYAEKRRLAGKNDPPRTEIIVGQWTGWEEDD